MALRHASRGMLELGSVILELSRIMIGLEAVGRRLAA